MDSVYVCVDTCVAYATSGFTNDTNNVLFMF